jgi:uncharacterized Zn finger protein
MSDQQQQGDRPMPARTGGILGMSRMKSPPCPKCTRAMTIKQVMPLMFTTDIDDVLYRCEDCGTELKRSVKRD